MTDAVGEPVKNGFYLAVIGDDNEHAEPIRVQDGFWYSTGCADPHSLDSVEIIRELNLTIPNRFERELARKEEAEEEAWEDRHAHMRQHNYDAYRREFRLRYGRDPGHRRWP